MADLSPWARRALDKLAEAHGAFTPVDYALVTGCKALVKHGLAVVEDEVRGRYRITDAGVREWQRRHARKAA